MDIVRRLSNSEHPLVQGKAKELGQGKETALEILESFFYYLRDEIKFGFPPVWDVVTASQTIEYGMGYCNTKATLLRALCQVVGIPTRIHCGLIDLNIMRGIFPDFAFPFLPAAGSHSWTEVQINDQWKPIDTYINDKLMYEGALKLLKVTGKPIGYSISFLNGQSSCEFNFGDKGFVHMGAVIEDHGSWDDLSDYFATDRYVKSTRFQKLAFRLLTPLVNQNIERVRARN